MNKDYQQLRTVFEGNDPFVSQGHQVTGLRRRKRPIPEWVRSNAKIREVLLRSFPMLETNLKQRGRAARWARIIHLYFRLQWTYTQVAEELEMKPENLKAMTKSIRRVARGRRADNKAQLGARRRGNPHNSYPLKDNLGSSSGGGKQ